jgi:hypothetical protein
MFTPSGPNAKSPEPMIPLSGWKTPPKGMVIHFEAETGFVGRD